MAEATIKNYGVFGTHLGNFESTSGKVKNGFSTKMVIAPYDSETNELKLDEKIELEPNESATADTNYDWFLVEPRNQLGSAPVVLALKDQSTDK